MTNPDIAKLTQAKFLSTVGKRTPLFLRFSTVGGEKGSADTARDPRGFAIKFYTEGATSHTCALFSLSLSLSSKCTLAR